MFHAFILGMDAFALGLIKAAKLIEDGRLDENIKNRYSSFNKGIGKTILDGTADLCSLAAHAETLGGIDGIESGKQEYLEGIVNTIMFS
jgi:xylose isomerase